LVATGVEQRADPPREFGLCLFDLTPRRHAAQRTRCAVATSGPPRIRRHGGYDVPLQPVVNAELFLPWIVVEFALFPVPLKFPATTRNSQPPLSSPPLA